MRILEDIISALERGVPIQEIRRGPLWTAVVSRQCGLASALNAGGCENPGEARDASRYICMTADELAALSLSDDIPEASLGLAAINSLIVPDWEDCLEVNASEFLLRVGREKNVSIIGHFPFVDQLRDAAKNLWVIEKRPRPGDVAEEEKERYIPLSDVVAISSTTLINHTLPSILELRKPDSLTIILGPTTPMSRLFFDYGIDIVSGSVVTDPARVLADIDRGISFSSMKRNGGIRLTTLVRDRGMWNALVENRS